MTNVPLVCRLYTLLFCLLYAWQLAVNLISHQVCARMSLNSFYFFHTLISNLFFLLFFFVCLFFTLHDRIHLTRAGWAAGAGWLEPCGCCRWTPLLPPSLSADALETRWPQHPPSPPPTRSCTHRGPRMHVNSQTTGTHMHRPWLMHAQVNEKNKQTNKQEPPLANWFDSSPLSNTSQTGTRFKLHNPL